MTDLGTPSRFAEAPSEPLELFLRYAPAAVAMFDRDMRYLAVSDRWLREFGLERESAVGHLHDDLFPEQAEHWRDIREACVGRGEHLADEDPIPGKDGSLEWIRWEVHPWTDPADPEGARIGGLLMYVEVITDRKKVEDALRYMATHDHLTGLLNRQAFLERLERSVERLEHPGSYAFAVFFFDLDGFKAVNDTYGHAVGDRLLQRVAERLKHHLRPKDALARFAGDEFVALVEDVTGEEASEVADRVTAAVSRPCHIESRVLGVSVSLGLALSRPGMRAEELMDEADAAMYEAKGRADGEAPYILWSSGPVHGRLV